MIDNLHVHYITAIYNSSFNVVNSYVVSTEVLDSTENSGKNPYKAVCQVNKIFKHFFILI